MTIESYKPRDGEETAVLEIYHRLIDAWNNQDAKGFGSLFSGTALVIGFDGSQLFGQAQIEDALKAIFSDHKTGQYVIKVRDIRLIAEHCFLLSAVAGLILPGNKWPDASKNAIQSMIVAKKNDQWYIELFQNTPAQFHGRPELAENLLNELNELMGV